MAKTLGFTLVALMLASPFRLAYGDVDPVALQNKAIAEVRACQATYRRTGACDQAQLNDAKANLLESNKAFHARGNYGGEALGDVFLAKIAGLISPGQSATEQFALYKSAAGLAQQGGNADYQSRALTGLAYVEGQEQNNISAGLRDATAAVDFATRANNSVDLFDALTTRAIVEARGSDIDGASNDYNRAVAIVNRVNDVNLVMSGYLDMEIIWQDQGTECQKDSQNPSVCEQEYGYAKTDLEKAAQIAHAQGYAFVVAQLIEPRQKELALLESELSKGQELRGQLATASATHITNASQVVMLRQFSPYQNPDTAKTMSQLLSQFGPLNASDERAPYVQGMLLEAEGKNDQALSSYMKAVSLLEQDRRSLQDPQSRTAFLSDRTEFYYAAILELLDHQRYSEAFALMERARARALADLLANRPPRVAKPEEQQLLAESLSINAQLAKDQQSLYNLTPGPDTNDEIQRLQAAIQDLERQSATVQSKIATQAPELNRLMAANPVSLQQAQGRPEPAATISSAI
ncbi:MAG TPA: hypothetical protein VMT95_11715 [Candidatus Binatia bacterium]|nr:hypothetical protein [Candidatus Binatia bacterium]